MPKEQKETGSDKIQFFGEVDLNKHGAVGSDMPSWYFERHIEELEENIKRKERMLERGDADAEQIPLIRGQIKTDRDKLVQIIASRPNLTGPQKDRCYKAYEKLAAQIKDTMPTRKETKQGLVNPRDELKRLKDVKHITVDPTIASACGVKADHGKITGDQANKMYQILGKYLGENTNIEKLRRDGGVESYKMENDTLKAVLNQMFEGKKTEGL